ncbi:flagellin N-terminal helical domain-containing protein [Mangrovitalea sediminis]|uniref:flagellin N-terminal helical domain-containing protein n=1 Tax=Mangrovitalea sediminis TaxID=1982043 RepID=UPI000BE629C9|nr:flagellin [Mangrovitalea sediminis]
MPQIINTNIASLNAQYNLNKSQGSYQTALQRLSSGLRINSAADDAAGLAIATRFQSQINGTNQAVRNAGDGISLAQTAGSALSSITDNLQRIRELAVQSANDTNTSVDRKSLQQEVSQLKAEIQNTATTTNFNGKKLLDGSFQNAQFQTGANVGQTISVSIAKVDTTTLGTAQSAGISSQLSSAQIAGQATGVNPALASGDLVINGVSVGASAGSSDTASTVDQSASAIAKAAAINAVSAQSGVTAQANATVAEGTDVTAASASKSGNISINGQTIAVTLSSGADVKTDLQGVADAINTKQDATGVSASVVATSDGFRIDLTAADGRNIELKGDGTNNASAYGLASAGASTNAVFTGTVTLHSTAGNDINLSTTTGDIGKDAGFSAGTFSGVNGGAVSHADTTATRGALASGDLQINGIDVGATLASDDTASTTKSSASGISLAAAINRVSGQTGVTATTDATNVYSGKIAGLTSGTAYDFKLNGVDISFTAGADTSSTQAAITAAVNAKSGQTGITASALGSDKFALTAADGRNVDVAAGGVGSSTDLIGAGSILTAATNVSSVSLQSAGQFTIGSQTANIAKSGFNVGSFGGAETGTKISDLDVSTVDGANKAIQAVDNALSTISSNQATLGAVQNRFSSTVTTLQSLSNNLTSAQSRIQDADFASTTAALSKAQVLQQAGISILAQANAQPKQVLSLLQ